MKLTANSKISLVLPRNITHRERFAADELSAYLQKLLPGLAVAACDDSTEVCGSKILLGGPERNAQTAACISEEAFDSLVPGPEGMFLRSFGEDTLVLAGSSKNPNECERGTVYAVYELLERYLDCSLSAYVNPGIAGGEYILQREELVLENVDYVKASADLKYRTAIVQYSDWGANATHGLNLPFLDWLAKNRYNRILTWAGVYEQYKENGMLAEAQRRGLRFTVGHHEASQLFLPPQGNAYFPEHYEETHPEFFKLKADGERFKVNGFFGQWIFCSRNEELIETVANNVISWISQNPSVDIVSFWPQDGIDEDCSCENCSKYTKVENYTFFLNSVAKKVSAVHPNVKIDMLVYTDLWDCPEGQKLEQCLLVDEATWHHTGLRKCGKPDGSGIIGTHFEALLNWRDVGAEVVYYDYYMGVYPARQRWIPIADEVQALCRHYVEQRVYGTGTQIECFNMWNHIFNFYTFARTAYDTSLSMEDNLSQFVRIFGEGAPFVAEVIRYGEATLDGQATIGGAGKWLMENIDREKVYGLYEQALSTASTPAARNNIRMMRMVFRYTDLEVQEKNSKPADDKYYPLEPYPDATGELWYLSTFSSFQHADPGYGIAVPVDCQKRDFTPDKWYIFE